MQPLAAGQRALANNSSLVFLLTGLIRGCCAGRGVDVTGISRGALLVLVFAWGAARRLLCFTQHKPSFSTQGFGPEYLQTRNCYSLQLEFPKGSFTQRTLLTNL